VTRWALGLEYDGARFKGWQRQGAPALPTVQAALEAALTRIADHPVATVCAGRTDAGVHATGQVVHFDTTAERPERAWVRGATTLAGSGITVRWARPVAADFHARFSARWRRYVYLMLDRRPPPAVAQGYVAHVPDGPLDAAAMDRGARHLLGEHDFEALRGAACQAPHAVREVRAIAVRRRGPLVSLDITANAFVLHMVRIIAGSLIAVGRGARRPEWIAELLANRDRTRAGATAPAAGLFLVGVGYGAEWGVPAPEEGDPLPFLALG